jgi:hypothetical protein
MFQDAYVKCDRLETEDLLQILKPHLEGGEFSPEQTVIMIRPLPFYPGYTFIDIADHKTMPARRRFVIRKKDDIVVLDFTNAPIYALNARAGIELTADNLPDYVRFFFSFVRGRHGRFLITESVDDINWREEPPPTARKAVAKMLKPLAVDATHPDGTVHFTAQMMFKDTLFEAEIDVKPDGFVKLFNEKLLIEDMPVMDDTFGQ